MLSDMNKWLSKDFYEEVSISENKMVGKGDNLLQNDYDRLKRN